MADLNFSFGYTRYTDKASGRFIDRPMMPIRLSCKTGVFDGPFLVDSGADFSMIPRALAEGFLHIDVGALPREGTNGVGGAIEVGVTNLNVLITQHGRKYDFDAPFQVPINCPGFPALPLLGREPLFHHFDVSFRQDYTTSVGKFVLKQVTKRRPADKFRSGGRTLP